MTRYLIIHKETGVTIAEPRDLLEARAVLMVDPERTEIREIAEDEEDEEEEQGK